MQRTIIQKIESYFVTGTLSISIKFLLIQLFWTNVKSASWQKKRWKTIIMN